MDELSLKQDFAIKSIKWFTVYHFSIPKELMRGHGCSSQTPRPWFTYREWNMEITHAPWSPFNGFVFLTLFSDENRRARLELRPRHDLPGR